MLEYYKGRTVEEGQEVKVYFNLHKNVFSIKDKKTGLVLGHSPIVQLINTQFEVNQKGRERVLKEKRKNVHAYVLGQFKGVQEGEESNMAYYNPYRYDSFVDGLGNKLDSAESVTLKDKKIFY